LSRAENSTDASQNRLEGLPDRRRIGREPDNTPQLVDAQGAGTFSDMWSWAARISQIGLFVLAIGYTAYITQSVLVPIILSWVVATILLPIVDVLERHGFPRALIVIILILALLAVVLTLIELLSVPLTYWVGRASELGALVKEKLHLIRQPLAFLDEIGTALAPITGGTKASVSVVAPSTNIVSAIASTLTPIVGEFVLFFIALVFNLIYQREIREGVVGIFTNEQARIKVSGILKDIEKNISVYFGTLTIVNICLGAATMALAYAVGLPNPLLWGVLAATMNYVPYLGAIIVTATLLIIGLLTFPTIGHAFIAPIAYVAMTTIEGQFITPTIMGHRLTMNPFLIFISIAFWLWMWGPIGAFLAVPIVMTMLVSAQHLVATQSPGSSERGELAQ
jgi:predicted PurR-regulated permease PerM